MSRQSLMPSFVGLALLAASVAAQSPAPAASPAASPAAEAKKEDKWDVAADHGPTKEIVVDTREGTWMSLDVSPDGQEIVFDLLGDIFVIPIAGGEAKAIASGPAWEMQPRFSPDGRRIAFTSDRAGGDNVWVMDRDGKNPKQVSKESFRLLNQPAWSPDGDFIAARKHFTSGRSLGAGEMWLYHRSGGDGVQLVKKPNDQKDMNEPAFSPDGRYLYYSQDTTPGATFQYNKNPHDQVFVIQRLDRVTGETIAYVTGAGGAVRPTPSPDGKSLAFVRRVREKSVLFVKDLESGRETPVFDGLERDMQEAWSIHGLYPSMAWTPDSKQIVLWAGGKLHRLDLATKQAAEIPFHVEASHRVAEALRFPVEVAPERFPVRMVRWAEVSPDGKQVVYQALGVLWVKDLASGAPRRLTTQNEHFEHFPSWSRDGKWVAYTTWSDESFGSVRVVSAAGGPPRTLTDKPGHYVEPAFTPDGKQIAYRRVGGGFTRSPLWSSDPGVYVVPAAGGASTRVTRRGTRPHFGAASDRVYLLANVAEGKRELISVELDGSDERSHAISENATEFRVSPDGRWLAFAERFHAFVTPFVATGGKLELGPKTKSIPVAKVDRDAGEWLHWSGDAKKLHWSLGPELFTRELKDAFAFLDGAPEKLPEPASSGLDIAFEQAADVPSGVVAFVGGRVITMKGDEVIDDGVVLVERNRIKAVGKRGEVAVPPGAHVVDAAGRTVMPGLIDAHWHGGFGQNEIVPQRNWVMDASLAFGVTTIHDPSNDTSTVFAASELARAGRIVAPRIYSTGTILYGAAGDFKAEIDSLEDARTHLRRMKAVGAISVKSYNQPRREQRQQVIQAAREIDMMVVPEGGSLYQHNMTMVLDGHTGIEHSVPVARLYDDALQLWSQTKTGYTPTLVVGYGGLSGEYFWYERTNVWENGRLLSFVPREQVDARSMRRDKAAGDWDYNHFRLAADAKRLRDRGVSVQIGAHGQREGLGAHWEIWMLAQGGMSAHEALRAATLDGARYLGMDEDLGSLEPGKLADVIVIDGDVLADLRQSEKVRWTMVNGRLYDAATMDEAGLHPNKRPPLWFKR